MKGEIISRAQLLLQYYVALAELEAEGQQMAEHARMSRQTAQGEGYVDQIRRPMVLETEARASA